MPTNTARPCHAFLDADDVLMEHSFTFEDGTCQFCGWTECAMGCGTLVPDLHTRCAECHPLECPCSDCRDCECARCVECGLAGDSSGVPVAEVGDDDTSAVRTVRAAYEPIGVEGLGDVRARRRAA